MCDTDVSTTTLLTDGTLIPKESKNITNKSCSNKYIFLRGGKY